MSEDQFKVNVLTLLTVILLNVFTVLVILLCHVIK